MDSGWIKLYRRLLDWEWYSDANVTRLFIHLLLKAQHAETKYRGEIIKSGSVLTGRIQLSAETGLTEQQVRSCLKKLKSTNEITIKTTNKYSIISINNWDSYQQNNQQTTQRPTNKQPTNNQQVTTYKNDKNKKNERKQPVEMPPLFLENNPEYSRLAENGYLADVTPDHWQHVKRMHGDISDWNAFVDYCVSKAALEGEIQKPAKFIDWKAKDFKSEWVSKPTKTEFRGF